MLYIYKSSAGSGKTYTLVREYLRLALKHPQHYKHILAITFTNKAANEMKERVLRSLIEMKEDSGSLLSELALLTQLNASEIKKRAAAILTDMLHHYGDIAICTIDSFTHKVIRSFTYDLNLPMNFEIEMDSEKLLQETIELLLDKIGENEIEITNALVEFSESKIDADKSWNTEQELIKFAKQLFQEGTQPYLEHLANYKIEDFLKVRKQLQSFVKAFEAGVIEQAKEAMQLIHQAGLKQEDFYQTKNGIYAHFQRYSIDLSYGFPEGKSHVLKTINEDLWYKKGTEPDTAQRIDSIKDQLRDCYQNIQHQFAISGADYYVCNLLLQKFYSFTLLTQINQVLQEYKVENNLLHISEFQERISTIVREQEAPIIYERIGEWYDHILIDEFQDTSLLQWRNLLPLVENTQFKNEDSLIVGDGKQAIYRFRGGEVEQFAALPDVYGSEEDELLKQREVAIHNYGYEVKNLNSNFRSRNEIIQFNNGFYDTMLEVCTPAQQRIFEDHRQQAGRNAVGGYVRIDFLAEEQEEGETQDYAELLFQKVEALIADAKNRDYAYRDIAILCRGNKVGAAIAAHLIAKNISVVSSESLLIHQSPKVKFLLSVLAYFENKENGILQAEILSFIEPNNLAEFKKRSVNAFQQKVSEVIGKPFNSKQINGQRLFEMLHCLIGLFGLEQSPDPFLQFFLDEVIGYSAKYGNNVREFLEWWDEEKGKKSIIYPESLDAVRILTIHKSKGLQFPVVIMPDADWKQKNNKDFFWVNMQKDYASDLDTFLLPVHKDLKQTEFAPLYEAEESHSFLDMLNLVYVATTRAEDMLYIVSKAPKKELNEDTTQPNSVTRLLEYYLKKTGDWKGYNTYEFGDLTTQKISKTNEQPDNIYLLESVPCLKPKTANIRLDSQLLWSAKKREKIDWGNLIHETISKIKDHTDAEKQLQKLLFSGLVTKEELTELQAEITAIIHHTKLTAYFQKGNIVLTERPIVTANKELKIPDRVILDSTRKSAVILDFKTGDANPKHHAQLNRYADALYAMGIAEVKKMLVYTETKEVVEV